MSGHAYPRYIEASQSEQFREQTDVLRWELSAGERVGFPVRRKRRWPWIMLVGVATLAGGGWFALDGRPAKVQWLERHGRTAWVEARAIVAELWRETSAPAAPAAELPTPGLSANAPENQPPPAILPEREVAPTQVAAVVVPPQPMNADAAASDASPSGDEGGAAAAAEKPAPLPPLPPLTDPLQKKAEASGLHPELSRAVLQSLSDVDFRNAAAAVRKAVAETPDDGVLIWPAKPSGNLARFRIHFVLGVSAACRRYVVGVAKSGWVTTALPMERCGVKPRPAKPAPAKHMERQAAQYP